MQCLDELYKAAKLEANEAPGRPAARAHDSGANIENGDSDDQEAGPELPLDFEEDVPDDEEGRFFGGGVSKETRGALDYVDKLEEGIQMVCKHPHWAFLLCSLRQSESDDFSLLRL